MCLRLREWSDVPVIMLSAKDTESDRAIGLSLGADDYVTKPLSWPELAARTPAVLGGQKETPGRVRREHQQLAHEQSFPVGADSPAAVSLLATRSGTNGPALACDHHVTLCVMRSLAPIDRFHDGHRQYSTDTVGVPSSFGHSQTDSEESVTATLAALQQEITILQQVMETLRRELAHAHQATNPPLRNAQDPVQRLVTGYNGPPARLDLTASQPGRPADGARQQVAKPLTRTEEAILWRLMTKLSLREIGRERYVSRDTIKSHVRSIYSKLGVSDRHEAVQRGRELGLLTRRQSLRPVS